MSTERDPWSAHVVVAEEIRGPQPRWWNRVAGEIGFRQPWWEAAPGPAFGDSHASMSPNAWIGLALTKKAFEGGPSVHTGSFDGTLTVSPRKLIESLQDMMALRPVRYLYGRRGLSRLLFSSEDSMVELDFYESGRSCEVTAASSNEEFFKKLAKLCDGILSHESPKDMGYVYALVRGMQGYSLTRLGAAGTPLERGNYTPKVVEAYEHIVADLNSDSPCGRLIVMAGEPGGGKTYMIRSLLAEVPKAAFVIVPSHLVKELGSPELLPALAGARHGGMDGPMALIVEDADKVLVNREAGDMAAISSLLNMGDGIMGSLLDIRIIATTNANELEMDAATRRPGRMCRYVNVGAVEPTQAESIIHRLTGQYKRPKNKVTLAEVYGYARELGWEPPPRKVPPSPWQKDYIL